MTIEGSARYGNAELYAEGLPPVVPLKSSGTLGSLSTDLGFLFATGRWYLDGRHVSLGLGETLYHQVTTRSPSGEIDRSDIAGLRYELRGIESYGKSRLSLELQATPVMRGGVRYINFAAAYTASGSLADRNHGLAFTLGALARTGAASP